MANQTTPELRDTGLIEADDLAKRLYEVCIKAINSGCVTDVTAANVLRGLAMQLYPNMGDDLRQTN